MAIFREWANTERVREREREREREGERESERERGEEVRPVGGNFGSLLSLNGIRLDMKFSLAPF